MKRTTTMLALALILGGCGKDDPTTNKNNDNGDQNGQTIGDPDMGTPDEGMDPDMSDPDMPRQPPTCEPFSVVSEGGYVDAESAFYFGDSSDGVPTDTLSIEVYEAPAPGTYQLGENYETCLHCVLIYAGCTDLDPESCSQTFLATEGTLEITTVGAEGEYLVGSISNVQFEEVTIDWADTFRSSPVAGGELRCVDGHDFESYIGTFCDAEGDPCEAGRPDENPDLDCVDDGTGTGDGVCMPAGGNTLPEICTDTAFSGQIGNDGDHDGGIYTDTPYANDAGLQAVWDAITQGDDQTFDFSANPLAVSGAIVTATDFGDNANWHFWVQDANAALQVRLTDDTGAPTPPAGVTIKVGQAVSFNATAADTFNGHPQIKTVDGFTVDSEDNAVYVKESFDSAVEAADYGMIVRVGGTLGTPNGCGANTNCFPMTHGTAGDLMTTFRSASNIAVENACAVFVGPVSGFPGPKATGGITTVQVDTANFDWMLVP